MGDFLCKELSTSNKWWLPKYRYLELRYFALQYPEWKRRYGELENGVVSVSTDILRVNASKVADTSKLPSKPTQSCTGIFLRPSQRI